MTTLLTLGQHEMAAQSPRAVQLATGQEGEPSGQIVATTDAGPSALMLAAALVACALGAGAVIYGLGLRGRSAQGVPRPREAALGASTHTPASTLGGGDGTLAPSEREVLDRAARALGLTQGAIGAMRDHAARRGLASPLGLVLGDGGGSREARATALRDNEVAGQL